MTVINKSKLHKPKIGFCAAFEQGYEILKFVFQQNSNIEFVATCERDDSEYQKKIVELCESNNAKTFRKIDVNENSFLSYLTQENIDIIVLAWWPTIIKSRAINSVNIGWINLHPTLLPYGRGKHGYFWSIVEDTPFGVTIHFIHYGIDTGPILFQKRIPVTFEDTGQSLYDKGVKEVINLFKEKYSDIVSLNFTPKKQDNETSTFHYACEIDNATKIDLNEKYKAIDLINLIRARTFWSGPSVKINHNGYDYYIKLQIEKIEKD